ncbi:acyltransferase [Desulfomicrobium baculatum]|uniref:Transferase hexapeptide repeat containing protein n=1 Tax=Desulfomicrobium baculatum (strain DSM 4028 / VKM B-1378 / X) TaxID=525897 RepID=C7LP14_DESBD|nr:acyltransferase [Desulfomicrobium baculatum]ACU91330.1 transferase hexapeptide repeat containing protein [Desulfomicrobium baculatum DSM 4028]
MEQQTTQNYFAHESCYVDNGAQIGQGTRIWHFSHIMPDAVIGEGCNLGQNVVIASKVTIGNNVKIQNNVSVYGGTVIEDDVFLGPSCVLTNVTNPRSQVNRQALYETTLIRRGATIGANATVVCGITIGRYAFIAAGSVIARDVPDYALIMGVPGKQVGWMSRHGHRLDNPDSEGIMVCPESGYRYQLKSDFSSEDETASAETGSRNKLVCLDLDEESPLPADKAIGSKTYDELKA